MSRKFRYQGAKICIKIADEAACLLAGLPNICGCQKSKEINQNATINNDQPQGAKRQQKAIKAKETRRRRGRRKRQTDVCPRRLVAAASLDFPSCNSSIQRQTDGPTSLSGQQNASNTFGARKMCLPSQAKPSQAKSGWSCCFPGQVLAIRAKSVWVNA